MQVQSSIVPLIVIAAILGFGSLLSVNAQEPETREFSSEDLEWFEREVRPLFAEHCSSCHSTNSGTSKGGLNLDSLDAMRAGGESGPAIVPGEPDESLLIEAIRRESFEMPPEKALSARDQATFEKWVSIGAPWPKSNIAATEGDWLSQRIQSHWSWQPVQRPAVPIIENDSWSSNAIDKFILSKLRQNDLEPAGPCDSPALLRRLSFDLTGLPPAAVIHSAVIHPTVIHPTVIHPAEPLSDEAYAAQVERYMSSPEYGVRWGRHWLDLVRYAETLGHEFDYPLHHAWRYRDAIVDTFNSDVAYDQIVREHLAGDLITSPRLHPTSGLNQSLALTGFWWLGDSVHAPVDIKNDWATRVDNQIDVVSKTFMGMTIACARCHDHKFDAITVDDYYGLAGMIESSRREYAITDPKDKVAKHNWQIRQQIEQADVQAHAAFAEPLSTQAARQWLDAYLMKLKSLDPKNLREELSPSSPFFLLKAVVEGNSDAKSWEDAHARDTKQTFASEQAFQKWESESERVANFRNGVPDGWSVQAIAAPSPVSLGKNPSLDFDSEWWLPNRKQGTYDWYSTSFPIPNRQGVLSSQRLGLRQRLTLQSPTFDVSRNAVSIKTRGKSAQSSLIVSNYFMNEFHSLLFKNTRMSIDQTDDSGWITHKGDLNKYIGHPAYLSIQDSENGWFEIEEVRIADRPPPPQPAASSLQLLERDIQTPEDLLDEFANLLAAAWESSHQANGDQVLLVREMLRASERNELTVEPLESLRSLTERSRELDSQTPAPTILLATRESSPRNAAVALRGNPHQRGDAVARTCFVSITTSTEPAPTSSGRLELADTLTREDHPLTSRVIVNRVWHHLLGRGLVASPDNLGVLGGRPSHPELLDYLAAEFIEHQWSIKWLVREIVTSSTYRLSSIPTQRQRNLDGDGTLLSHRSVRRLSAESVRDAMLFTVGSLDLQQGGPSVPVHLNDQMTGRGRPKDSGPLDGENRRSLFVEVRRNFLDPLLLAFDFPMPSTSAGGRGQSNVPAQALGLLNDPLVAELTERWKNHTAKITQPEQRVAAMIGVAFNRPATELEIRQCVSFTKSSTGDAWQELAHVLINSKEFSYLR